MGNEQGCCKRRHISHLNDEKNKNFDFNSDDQSLSELSKPVSKFSSLIDLKLKAKRDTILSSTKSIQTFPLMASIQVGQPKGFDKSHLDIVCVIDQSGSMAGGKMNLVKDTLKALLNFLDENDRISIITFNSEVSLLSDLTFMTFENKIQVTNKIDGIKAEGGTDIILGLLKAIEVLDNRRTDKCISSIMFLSDGQDSREGDRAKVAIEALSFPRGVVAHLFGFGQDHDSELLVCLANKTEGSFYYIENNEAIKDSFAICIGTLSTVILQEGEVKFIPYYSDLFVNQISLTRGLGDQSIWKKNDEIITVKTGQIISGKTLNFLVELLIPKLISKLPSENVIIPIAKAELKLIDLDGNEINITRELKIKLLNEKEIAPEIEENRDVMQQFYRVLASERMADAKKFAESNNYRAAQSTLNELIAEIESSKVKNETFVKNIVKDLQRAKQDAKAENFNNGGKHNLIGNARAQGQERSYTLSSNAYSTVCLDTYVDTMRAWSSKL